MIVMHQKYCFSLFAVSCTLFLVYTAMAFRMIICRYKTFDRFTLVLTGFGLLALFTDTGSALGAWLLSRTFDDDVQISQTQFRRLFLVDELNLYSCILLSVCFMVFAFKLNA